jgi:tetratricopeptide (TPR) repeat protein
MSAPHYKAFISYSHRDEPWARWLQHALESYRVPRRLVGQPGSHGPIPARLNPVFRDREDLSSAADLSAQIKQELDRSESLVVICSPSAVASPWVSEEIRYFQSRGKADRILALIVSGDPQASNPDERCFPPAILQSADGSSKEPLAADARKYADGRQLALLKIVAGILGIRLDELRRRDAQRTTRSRLAWTLLTLAAVSVLGWLTWSEATTRAAALEQRANTEELLGFMLGDLKRLAPIEGLETIPPDDEMQLHFREQFQLAEMGDQALLDSAMQWRDEGIDSKKQIDLSVTMELFQRSRAALIELNQRDTSDTHALFELGQAEYYVGETLWSMGELDQAERAWARYGAVTRRLVNAEPSNARYVMELSYTLTNLGALELVRIRPNATRLLQLIQVGVQYNQMALVLDPGNAEFRDALPNNLAWQADAWLEKCELEQALEIRQQAVRLRRELLAEDAGSPHNQSELAAKLTGLAGVQQMLGLDQQASNAFEEIQGILGSLHEAAPDDSQAEWELYYRQARYAHHLLATGDVDGALAILDQIEARYDELSNPELTGDYDRAFDALWAHLDRALAMLERGQLISGRERLSQVLAQLEEMVAARPEARNGLEALARAEFENWRYSGISQSVAIHPALDGYLSQTELAESCSDADIAARLAVVNGDLELAKRYTGYVLSKGYREAGFLAFCREYALCELP